MLDSIFKVKEMTSKTCTQKVYSFAEKISFKIIFEVLVIMLIIKFCMRINIFKLILS